MNKDIKDYLHLYLACECKVKVVYNYVLKSVKWVDGTFKGINCHGGIEVQCRSIDGENWPDVDIYKSEDVKPILRPLSDMTEEEATFMWELMGWNERVPKELRAADIISEFNAIEDDNGNSMNSEWGYLLIILPYMLTKGFDLFGLIYAGLAIDKTNIK